MNFDFNIFFFELNISYPQFKKNLMIFFMFIYIYIRLITKSNAKGHQKKKIVFFEDYKLGNIILDIYTTLNL